MQITQLYISTIKSLRPTTVQEANVTPNGLSYDRHFMLIKRLDEINEDGTQKLKNMHVSNFPEMTLFLSELVLPNSNGDDDDKVIVRYNPPVDEEAAKTSTTCKESRTIEIPLKPDVNELKTIDIVMHNSPTTAHDMGSKYNSWFSECFGFEVILAYIGRNRRQVLGSMAPSAQKSLNNNTPLTNKGEENGWLSLITSGLLSIGGLWGGGGNAAAQKENEDRILTFSDCASYLVASETSLHDVSDRLPDGEEMDVSKFRPNVVVSGAPTAWEEDFWGELSFQPRDEKESVQLILTSNCVRCVSINIDYASGKPGKGPSGQVFKRLTKDRRVDAGSKYSPVFGRYGFLKDPSKSVKIRVGDNVEVSKRLAERTTFDWPL